MIILLAIYVMIGVAIWLVAMYARFRCWPWNKVWWYAVHSEREFACYVAPLMCATWPVSVPVILVHSAMAARGDSDDE